MPHGKQIGTLVVVVLKARHLKDSHTFYKQDPYVLIQFSGTRNQTKVDPRGGQHPVWDEEFRFPVFESVPGVDSKAIKIAAYSKEPRTDELIGEGEIDVSETLEKGEFDDWVKLQLNGSFRGEVYLEMTFYSATPPLARRPSKLSPKDRLWRPPVTPPKNKTSPNLKPQRSPLLGPTVLPANVPDPSPSIPPGLPPQLRPGVPATIREDVGVSGSNIFQTSHIPPLPSQHSPRPPSISPRREDMPLPPVPPPPQQSLGDPTLRHIPYFNIYPSTETPKPSSQAQNIQHVPSILRPRNAKSSPIPLSNRQPEEPPSAFRDDYEDPQKRFQRELAVSDAEFAARLAEQEGINLERLRMEEADADLARRLSQEDEEQARRDGSIPGGWVE